MVQWRIDEQAFSNATLLAGVYILKTDRTDPPPLRNDSRATVRKIGYG